jgi:hypothetical protein
MAANDRKPVPGVSWENFRWIVGGGAALIFGLLLVLFNRIDNSITKLESATQKNGLEIIRAVGAVETQLAITNTKLDSVIGELRQGRPKQ